MNPLNSQTILDLFNKLNSELAKGEHKSELHIVGGAVMCLVLNARASTLDIDGLFVPSKIVRELAKKIGLDTGIGENWLNDGVKGFFSEKGSFDHYLELTHLKIYTTSPEYLLAMKCLAMRIGAEFHDIPDIRYLLRYLNIENDTQARDVISHYYPIDKFPQKTLNALEEILEDR